MLSDVQCEGDESSLLMCPGTTPPGDCLSGKGAAVICQGKDMQPIFTKYMYKNVYVYLYVHMYFDCIFEVLD